MISQPPAHCEPPDSAARQFREHPAKAPDASTLAPGLILLPEPVRADIFRLHGVLRTLDDAVDLRQPQAEERLLALERWAEGRAPSDSDTAELERLVARYSLRRRPFADLCKALQGDLGDVEFETEAELDSYCDQVGGAVAVILAQMLGTRSPEGEAQMAALGRAAQLTNILRDVEEDRARGHRYLPRCTIERFSSFGAKSHGELVRFEVTRAEDLYAEGMKGVALLAQGQRGIGLCAALYRELLREIARQGFDCQSGPIVVPAWRRHLLTLRYRLWPTVSSLMLL